MKRIALSPVLRLVVAVFAGVLVALVGALLGSTLLGLIGGLAVATATFVGTSLVGLWPMDADGTKAYARREDFSPRLEEVVVVSVSLASLGAIGALLALSDSQSRAPAAVLSVVGAFMAWATVHVMYATRYAYLFYGSPGRSTQAPDVIDFNSDVPPTYRDFFYFSFTIGMTYAVSDSNIRTTELRAVTIRHALLSYLFGTVILAATINLVASIIAG